MMPPMGRKHRGSLPPDVFTSLPNNVIDVILMCLPCKDAVRTSILSKKWRYNWCRLTELTLDTSLWGTQKDILNPAVKFTKIIYQLLTLHEGPITKFTLNIGSLKSCPMIDNFIYFLSRNDIQHLVLFLPRKEELYNLPSSLFTCSRLRHLTLNNCSIHPPSGFQGFDRLITLELDNVSISSELLGSLIAHCPLLEKLVLQICLKSCPKIDNFIYFLSRNGIQHLVLQFPRNKRCRVPSSLFTCLQLRHLSLYNCIIHHPSAFEGFDRLITLELCEVIISSELLKSLISHCPLLERLVLEISELFNIIEINAPMLRCFDFKGYISSLCLKNVPLLAKLSLIGKDSFAADYVDFRKLFESCPALEHLLLDFWDAELFMEARDEAPTRLPFDINSVRHFYLPQIVLMDSYGLSCALCWIRSFPYLEYLAIKVYNDSEDDHIPESLELERFSDVTFNHLREVKLGCFIGIAPEMQLIKLFLAKSPVLVRILIDPWIDDEPLDTRSEILDEVSNFTRASPEAEVVYQSKEKEE